MDIGFIGLGEMGAAMVANMLKAGHSVRVWNRSPDKAQPLVELGAQIVGSPAEAFTGDAVFSMLADDAALRDVISASLLEHAPRGLIHVNMATISVALAINETIRGSATAEPRVRRARPQVAQRLAPPANSRRQRKTRPPERPPGGCLA